MNGLWKVVAVLIASLLLIAGAVFGLGDRGVLVSPPEAVAENFMRALSTGRYDMALPYLSDGLARTTDAASLKAYKDRLEAKTGAIEEVKGENGRILGEQAVADAVLKTERAGEVTVPLRMERSEGEWTIRHIGEIQ